MGFCTYEQVLNSIYVSWSAAEWYFHSSSFESSFQSIGYDYTAYMDYMDLAVPCWRKVGKMHILQCMGSKFCVVWDIRVFVTVTFLLSGCPFFSTKWNPSPNWYLVAKLEKIHPFSYLVRLLNCYPSTPRNPRLSLELSGKNLHFFPLCWYYPIAMFPRKQIKSETRQG